MVSISTKNVTKRTATASCRVHFSNTLVGTLIRENRAKKGDVFAVARVAGIMAAKRTADLIPLCHPIPISHVGVTLQLHRWAPRVPPVAPVQESVQAEAAQDSQTWAGTEQGDAYKWPSGTMSTLEGSEGQAQPGVTQHTAPTPEGDKMQPQADGKERSWVAISATVECDGKTGVEMEALTAASVAALTVYDMCKAVDKGMLIEGLRVTHKEGGKSGTWKEGVSVG
jgi:molybdenum cofactor biosynthesis enzyme